MASSRTAAQRRRARSMARQTTSTRVVVPAPPESEDVAEPDQPVLAAPWWPAALGLVVCVAGLGVSAYLTYAHFNTHVQLACPDTGIINCTKVTTSVYSHLLGIPVAVLGLVFFAAMIPLLLPGAWRSRSPLIRIGRVGASVVGVGMVLWLVYAELFLIKSICIYCTAVHVLTFVLFVIIALGTVATTPEPT